MVEDNPKIIPRKQAIALGLKKYFTGKPCKYGHLRERSVLTRSCPACDVVRIIKKRRLKNPINRDVKLKALREWREANKELSILERKKKAAAYYQPIERGCSVTARIIGTGSAKTAGTILSKIL